ncbi:uncharacterized protein LOC110846924 [Folsomia candida]|nr:uncharacterized protein LOC110846924 [Folsomia candida]
MCSTCFPANGNRVRVIVFTDLVIALFHTIYRVAALGSILKRVFDMERGQQINKNNEDLSLEQLTIMKFSTVFLITAAVVGLALEMFLFFLLNNGYRSKNYRHCRHWFIARILILILSVLGSVIEHVRNEYTLIDGILEIEKLYRVVTLILVRNFMVEICKGLSDNHYEYNSSGVGDGYPNGIPSMNNMRSHSHSHATF